MIQKRIKCGVCSTVGVYDVPNDSQAATWCQKCGGNLWIDLRKQEREGVTVDSTDDEDDGA